MPNLRSSRQDSTGIELVASNGKGIVLSSAQIITKFVGQIGTLSERKTKTQNWGKDQIVLSLGNDMIDKTEINWDFNSIVGYPTLLEIGN